jgi:hypothetical protein
MVFLLKGDLILLNYKNSNYIALSSMFLFALFLSLFFLIIEDSFSGLVIEDLKDYFDHLKNFSNIGVFMVHFKI